MKATKENVVHQTFLLLPSSVKFEYSPRRMDFDFSVSSGSAFATGVNIMLVAKTAEKTHLVKFLYVIKI